MGSSYSQFAENEMKLLNPVTSSELENFTKPNIETNRINQFKKVQQESLSLFQKKNHDYGDAFAKYGPIGVLVRMGDKLSRLQTVTSRQISLINTESIRDTLIDLHNYSAMAIMLLDELEKKDQSINLSTLKSLYSAD